MTLFTLLARKHTLCLLTSMISNRRTCHKVNCEFFLSSPNQGSLIVKAACIQSRTAFWLRRVLFTCLYLELGIAAYLTKQADGQRHVAYAGSSTRANYRSISASLDQGKAKSCPWRVRRNWRANITNILYYTFDIER